MASIGFRIKSKENKQVSIYVYFRAANSSVVSARTGLSVNPSEWSSSKKMAKPNDPFLKKLNTTLNDLKNFIYRSLNNDQQLGIEIDNRWLPKKVNEFNNKVPQSDQSFLINLLDDVINNLKYKAANDGSLGLKIGTVKGYNNFRNVLLNFENDINQQLKFNARDNDLIDEFSKWLVE